MAQPTTVDSKAALHASTAHFDGLIRNSFAKLTEREKKAMRNAFAHARAWIAYPDGKGGFIIGFSKFVGHPDIKTVAEYDRWRVKISGSDTERAIKSFGIGTDYPVGSSAKGKRHHEAEQAVLDFCKLVGKTPNSLAVVRVMPVPDVIKGQTFERTTAYEVVLAAMRAADLSPAQREQLLVESVT